MIKLKGIDISHHNKNMKNVREINRYDFVIMKATEGVTYKDPALSYYMAHLDKEMLKGFYHFARPDAANMPEAEASNFLSTVLKYLDGKCILVLDVEGKALSTKCLDDWCLRWCKYVYDAVGIKPMIYTSEYNTILFCKTAAYDVGLWCAKWGIRPPKNISPWEFFAIWQQTNKHLVSGVYCDLDYFYGDRNQYLRYCQEVIR